MLGNEALRLPSSMDKWTTENGKASLEGRTASYRHSKLALFLESRYTLLRHSTYAAAEHCLLGPQGLSANRSAHLTCCRQFLCFPALQQMCCKHLSGSCTGPLLGLELHPQRRYTSMYALLETTRSAAAGAASSAADAEAMSTTGSPSAICIAMASLVRVDAKRKLLDTCWQVSITPPNSTQAKWGRHYREEAILRQVETWTYLNDVWIVLERICLLWLPLALAHSRVSLRTRSKQIYCAQSLCMHFPSESRRHSILSQHTEYTIWRHSQVHL